MFLSKTGYVLSVVINNYRSIIATNAGIIPIIEIINFFTTYLYTDKHHYPALYSNYLVIIMISAITTGFAVIIK